ncbi:hypothetical protein [Sphingobium nicotianae]|uniref:Uncharacterized protein n=1 Tax=Sphingobium nicotianae TaxID=2782607 RepID=A0A9X1IT16_9SPHN|nr:hypothetical protein [Sphingobium nicotianae]MBT2188877.1 hypothetical protein [Sphingobium nicotianae]
MFGVPLRSLFTSRWMALAWVVLVCLTAVQYVGPSDDDEAPVAQAGADTAAANAAMAALN